MIYLNFFPNLKILKLFQKKMVWSNQIISPTYGRPNIDSYLDSAYRSEQFCWRDQSSIFSRSEILGSGSGMKDAKVFKNMISVKFSTNHEVLGLFQKKWSWATRSSHQQIVDQTSIHIFTQLIVPSNFAKETKVPSSIVLKF